MHPTERRQAIRELIEPTIHRLGFDLVCVEWSTGRRRPVLRLSIDKPGGVGADDCAAVSHRVSPVLDAEDPIESGYDLEVSSPGIDRPVQRLDDFRRFVGYTVRLRMEEGLPRRRYTGEIVAVIDGVVHLKVDGEVHELMFDSIDAANLVLDIDTYMKLADGLPPIPEQGGPDANDATAHADRTQQEDT